AVKIFGKGTEIIAIKGNANRPEAIGIFSPSGWGSWQTFQPANVPLGPWLSGSGASLESQLLSLRKALPGVALLVGLSQLDPMFVPRPQETDRLKTLDYIKTARIRLNGSYEDYWKNRGKNLRHNMKRQRHRLSREGVHPRLEILSAKKDIGRAVADYAAMETRGWKGQAGSAVRWGDAQAHFYVTMLEGFAAKGEAFAYRFLYDDRMVAMDICLKRNGCLIVLKTAHDESCQGTSPAQLMRHEVMQEGFRTGEITTIEFYGPAQDWHRRWTDDLRTLYHVNCYRWSGLAALKAQLNQACA
ncbi:MAG: GNAT family N-acetyltransferase, partial [Planctomycetota bacterium]